MAITFVEQKRRQRFFLGATVAAILFTLFILWRGFSALPQKIAPSLSASTPKEVSIDFGIFDHPVFEELGQPSPPLVPPEKIGKANPFLPASAKATAGRIK